MQEAEVQQQLKTITNTIVREFNPEKIILFGSWAWGQPSKDSDVDLLVIKETSKSRRERESELHEVLTPRTLPMDILVYTPAELEERIRGDRNLFLEDIVQNGMVLYSR